MSRYQHYSTDSTIKERSLTAIAFVLLIGLFSAVASVMAYYFLNNQDILFDTKAQDKPSTTLVRLHIGGNDFKVPVYLISDIKRTFLRKVKKISLAVPVSWSPTAEPQKFDGSADMSTWMLATIQQNQQTLSQREWLTEIYKYYAAGPASLHSSRLYRIGFKSDSAYSGIEVFTDDMKNPSLIIRCQLQQSAFGTRLCSRKILISPSVALTYKFPHMQIGKWQSHHTTMVEMLKSIRVKSN